MIKYCALILFPIFYFSMSWFFPWEKIQFNSTISVSYLFDLLIIVVGTLLLKKENINIGKTKLKPLVLKIFVIIIFAFMTIFFSKWVEFNAPFKYIELLIIQLLILAPIIEELIFRGIFFTFAQRLKLKLHVNIFFNAILFSLSHLPAIWILPKEFHSFILFQLFYTFFLGWICAKSRHQTKGILEPILLHFVFNSVFYFAIKSALI